MSPASRPRCPPHVRAGDGAAAAGSAPAAEAASAEEARSLLRTLRLQLQEAIGDATAKAASERRMHVQLDIAQQKLQRKEAELRELQDKASAPLLSESAHECAPPPHPCSPLRLSRCKHPSS